MKNIIITKVKRNFFISIITLLMGIANSYAQWVNIDFPLSNNSYLSQIKYTSKNKIWGIGLQSLSSANDQVIYSNDGGHTFKINSQTGSAMQLPIIFTEPVNDSVAFSIAHIAVNSKLKYLLLKTINGGDSIQPYYIINGSDTAFSKTRDPQIVKFFDSKNGFIMGDTVNGCSEIYSTKNGGLTWGFVPCSKIHLPKNIALFSHNYKISSVNGFGVFLCGAYGQGKIYFITTNDYGDSWDSLPFKGWYGTQINDYVFKDSLNGLATLYGIFFSGDIPINTLAHTSDGGKTWDTSYSAPDAVGVIDYARDSISGKSFYIVGGPNGSYTSFDDGKTWNQLDTYEHDAIAFYNSHTGISSHPKQFIGDGILVFSGFTGINDIKNKVNEITIYPNPASNNITISSSSNTTITQINLFDIIGKNYLLNYKKENENFIIDVSELPTGIYFLQATTTNGVLFKKVLIEK